MRDFDIFPGLNSSQLRMEGIDGERHIEREYVAYVRVTDWSWVDTAPHRETHEQWVLDYGHPTISGRLRLINKRRYTECVKEKIKGLVEAYECEFDISKDAFEMKKKMAKFGVLKERFTFPIPGSKLKWEVDVFQAKAGGRSEWVKVDLEYTSKNTEIPEFPFPVNEVLIVTENMSPELESTINLLWTKEYANIDHTYKSGGKYG